MRRILYVAVSLVLPAVPSFAASFDCAKASSPVEKMICGDTALSQADAKLAEIFAGAVAATLDPQALFRTGILCAFKPQQKICRDRGP